MIIGLCGIVFDSVNYGVSALAYSQIAVIAECAKKLHLQPTYYVFSMDAPEKVEKACKKLGVDNVCVFEPARIRPGIPGLVRLNTRISQCDVVFDLTHGDSFSDIYGYKRFFLQALEKAAAIRRSKLVIAPQTIGPFANGLCRSIAARFIRKSTAVYARDTLSQECVAELCPQCRPVVTSDLAFYLPYDRQEKRSKDGKCHIGVNVSGLLWGGGYTGKNEFGLVCDYQAYTRQLLAALSEKEDYVVHLAGHVYLRNGDGDYKICQLLHDEFPQTVLAPRFANPMEAKTYFSGLDVLIGARMHATIGAISAGTVAIPVSYSRKFEGLYSSIQYPYVIEATKWDTDTCLNTTLQYIQRLAELAQDAKASVAMALEKNEAYKSGVTALLQELKERSKE